MGYADTNSDEIPLDHDKDMFLCGLCDKYCYTFAKFVGQMPGTGKTVVVAWEFSVQGASTGKHNIRCLYRIYRSHCK